jgi:hypothetical protein
LPLQPPAYSGYEDLWWRSFLADLSSALIGWWIAAKLMKMRRHLEFTGMAALVLLLGSTAFNPGSAQTLPIEKGTNAMRASARVSGGGMRVVGPNPVDMKSTQPMSGEIMVETEEMGNRWSHVQNTDGIRVRATFTSGGARYVRARAASAGHGRLSESCSPDASLRQIGSTDHLRGEPSRADLCCSGLRSPLAQRKEATGDPAESRQHLHWSGAIMLSLSMWKLRQGSARPR